MLFFLDFASRAGFRIDAYQDAAEGEMAKDARGKLYVAKVTLNPSIVFSGDKRPSQAEIATLHHKSHEECFIANSVKTEVVVAIVPPQFA
jgi:organic hydroperoxide reductase OsmC/OhrA